LGVPLSATRYRQFMLIVLLVIFAFNFVDRLVIGLVLQDIKTDLHLTDTQLGLLTGTAFAIFYSIMGLPIARWADRGNRVTLIAVTTLLWSAAVVLCGLVQSFWHLLSIRIGVAVGEAGCMPPAHSLIADHFNRAERPRAVSTYMLGAPLSAVIGYFLAGWLNELYGWRMTFVILGLPGIVLAAIAWITLREPRCSRESATLIRSSRSAPKLGLVAATLWRNVTFRHLLLCFAVTYFFGSGILQWQPAFFIRSFGLRTGELGTWFALIYGLGGLLGTYLGGVLASRYAANDERLQLKAMAAAYAGFGVVSAAIYTSQDVHFAFAMTALSAIGGTVAMGPMFAMIQSLVPPDMRAVSIAAL
jgi:predicted MFS family arabinose efflux permease